MDGPPPNFGAGGPRDTTNQTQQTHVGTLSGNTGGTNSGTLRYDADTQPANSGSPVIVEGGNVAIGIHTNGGCTSTGGTNAGTSFRNQALWTAIGNAAFTSWEPLDNNPATVEIVAGGGQLYQRHNSGMIWRYTGQPCGGGGCPGWEPLDNNPATVAIVVDGSNGQLYQRHNNGVIWRYTGQPCGGGAAPAGRRSTTTPRPSRSWPEAGSSTSGTTAA